MPEPGDSRPAGKIIRPGVTRLEGSQVTRLRYLRGEPPEKFYPPGARREGIDGAVIVDLLINEGGMVVEAQVISESPPGRGFGLATLDTAKTYEFENTVGKLVLMSLVIEFLP